MTCEVAVLNRMAVALAADSAVTFSSLVNNKNELSYATGANKIFQLSNHAPVGIMLFNNAELQDIPWELVIKSFRADLKDKVKESLGDYAEELHNFIKEHKALFPPEHRERHFRQLAGRSFLKLFDVMQNQIPELLQTDHDSKEEIQSFLKFAQDIHDANDLAAHFDADVLKNAKDAHGKWLADEIVTYFTDDARYKHLVELIDASTFANLSIESLFKFYVDHFGADYTGIVVAGFGSADYFPGFVEVRYYGFLLDVLIVETKASEAIGHQKESIIQAFAKKGMVETFLTGFSPEVWSTVKSQYRENAQQLVTRLFDGAELPEGHAEHMQQSELDFANSWQRKVLGSHYGPLTGVIAGLPPNEMAELAETLVMLESFKEKVTRRTQSVGGPIDVAVITKAEGLVWIKRKHYFNAELNSRYFARQSTFPRG